MGKEQRAASSGGLVVEVVAAVLSKLSLKGQGGLASSERAGGVGQPGMAHRSDGPASSLRMFESRGGEGFVANPWNQKPHFLLQGLKKTAVPLESLQPTWASHQG